MKQEMCHPIKLECCLINNTIGRLGMEIGLALYSTELEAVAFSSSILLLFKTVPIESLFKMGASDGDINPCDHRTP